MIPIQSITFSEKTLNSLSGLHHFFEGKAEIEDIHRKVQSGLLICQVPSGLDRCWMIEWLNGKVTWIYGCFLQAVSLILQGLGARDLAKRFYVYSHYVLTHQLLLQTFHMYRNHLLTPSVNRHRLDTEDIYLQSPRDCSFPKRSLHFYYPKGVCRGMCDWFYALYFKTHSPALNPKEHLKAISEQMSEGASRQATLLQAFEPEDVKDLIGLQFQEDVFHFHIKTLQEIDDIAKQIYSLPPGAYAIYPSGHRMNYIRTADDNHYLFNPFRGLIAITDLKLMAYAIHDAIASVGFCDEIAVDQVIAFKDFSLRT